MKAEYQELLQFIDACRARGVTSARVAHGNMDCAFTLGGPVASVESPQAPDKSDKLSLTEELDNELFGEPL